MGAKEALGSMGQIGVWQVILVLLIVLIIFGAGKLPKVMGDVAKGVKNFKRGMREEEAGDETGDTMRRIDGDAETPVDTAAGSSQPQDRTGTR